MRRKVYDDKFYMPKQYDVGTAEKDVTEPTETPTPLAKGWDGLPRFNELQDEQKKNMPKAMRTQVAFQQKKLQWANYQIINFLIKPTDSASSDGYYFNEYNQAVAVGTACDNGLVFGTTGGDQSESKYYNIVYLNARIGYAKDTSDTFLSPPSYVEFYPLQKVDSALANKLGGKIPRQTEAYSNSNNLLSLQLTGDEYGVQSFGVDVYNENAYYAQSKDLKGIRCMGLALKTISLNFSESTLLSALAIDIEIGYDLKSEGNNY